MIKRNLFIIFWVLVVIILLSFSLVFKDTNKAIVAQVEPMKKAISYHKAVKVLEIYVIPGQMVRPGDVLVKVERPDLILDVEKKHNDIDRLKVDSALTASKFSSKLELLELDKDAKLRNIEGKINQLQVIIANNQQLSNQFGSLTGIADTVQKFGKSYYEIELAVLKKEKEFVNDQYKREAFAERQVYNEEMTAFKIQEDQLHRELEALLDEENQLQRLAEVNGTVGSVNAQPGELLSPYSTILSIYESNPTVIKAIMNEGYHYDVNVGQLVKVESSNRTYSIEGKIMEVGARIIEYPNRLKANQNIPVYGRELFIRIPEKNNFLSGERVFVIIKD